VFVDAPYSISSNAAQIASAGLFEPFNSTFTAAPNLSLSGPVRSSAANQFAADIRSHSAGRLPGAVSLDLIDNASLRRASAPSIQSVISTGSLTGALRSREEFELRMSVLAGPPRVNNQFEDPILRYGGAALAYPRVQGTFKVAQAIGEYTVAAGLSSTGLGTPAALALGFHASDTLVAGFNEAFTGTPTQTLGSRTIEKLANSSGFQVQSKALGEAYDIVPAILAPLATTRQVTTYNAPSTETGTLSRSGTHPTTYVPGRYSHSASEPGAYLDSSQRVFPTTRNSGLTSADLRAEQQAFFTRGLLEGKSAAELRGQAAVAGYERRGGINNIGGPDRLADRGAENALQRAIQNTQRSGKAGR
jgi:hypothetical protein